MFMRHLLIKIVFYLLFSVIYIIEIHRFIYKNNMNHFDTINPDDLKIHID